MTPAEIHAYNAGVEVVLKAARDAAEEIARIVGRPVREDHGSAALADLAETGRALLLPLPKPDASHG